MVAEQYLKEGATCTTQAQYFNSCVHCGEASDTEFFFGGALADHSFTAEVAADKYLKEAATCRKQAEYWKSCSACGKASETDTFFAGELGGHDLQHVSANPATEASNGNKEHWSCRHCGKLFRDAAGAYEISAESVVIAKLPTVGTPNLPVGGNVYGFLADEANKILLLDVGKDGMTTAEFKRLLSVAITGDADNSVAILVENEYNKNGVGLICTTSKVTLTAENADGKAASATYDIVIMGDTNCNGRVESGDTVKIDRHYRGFIELTGLVFLAADTNRNGRLESGDAVKVMVKYQNSAAYTTALKK